MRSTPEAVLLLDDEAVERVLDLIRGDPSLGRGSCSSWEEVTPTDYEARERIRTLIEEGIVPVAGLPTPRAILQALRAAESTFWATLVA